MDNKEALIVASPVEVTALVIKNFYDTLVVGKYRRFKTRVAFRRARYVCASRYVRRS